jgi:formiminoglutamate deiminase
LRAVTADQLTALGALRPHQPIHIHVAEQTKEVDDCIAGSGARPIEWLLDHAGVDPSWCLVHATHVTSGELSAIAATDAVVGLCPVTEANLGDGIFPAGAFQAAGGRFGIGSDSNVLIDMTDELRLLEYGQRLTDRGRNRLAGGSGRSTADSLFNTAVLGGSQALGAGSGIEVGRSADFVSLNSEHPSLYGKAPAQILDAFVFAAGRSAIDSVWRAGTKVVQAGLHRDRQRIIERYKRVYTSLTA